MELKVLIKKILTIINHPIVSSKLIRCGCKRFYIAPQMTINTTNYLEFGNNISIGRNSRFLFIKEYHGGKYQPSLVIGNNVSIGSRFSALSAAPIVIGDNCLIASDVLITSENHGMDIEASESYANIPLIAKSVTIGKGCWLGEKVSIMPGVTLGDRCIVAANSVVTKSFPAYSLIGGMPAELIKQYNFETHEWQRIKE